MSTLPYWSDHWIAIDEIGFNKGTDEFLSATHYVPTDHWHSLVMSLFYYLVDGRGC